MHNQILCVLLHRVFHGIRLLRLIKIGCRETINFFVIISNRFSSLGKRYLWK